MSNHTKADLMLLIVTLGWGVSYILIDISLTDMGTFTLNANRFLISFFIAAALSYKRLKNPSRETIKLSVMLGFVVLIVYTSATMALKYTTMSNTAFLCALSVVFTPAISSAVNKRAPEKKLYVVVATSLLGIALLTLKSDFSINYSSLPGDLLAVTCALFYAIHILLTEKAVVKNNVNPYQLGVFQLGVTGVLNLIISSVFEKPHFPTTPKIWFAVLFLSIMCTGLAFIVQTLAQQYTTASHVGIIFSLEPVFASVAAYFIAHEVLSFKSYAGAILMIISLFVMEINFNNFNFKNFMKNENQL